VNVPNNFYNIRSSQGVVNNVLSFTDATVGATTATIAEGQYTITTLAAALKVAIDAKINPDTVAITQDAITQKLLFTFTGTTAVIDDLASGNLMAEVLGFTTTSGVTSATITPDSLPDLSGINMVTIHSKDLAQGNGVDGSSGLISAFETVSFHATEFGAFAYKQNTDLNSSIIRYEQPQNLVRIRLVLRDNSGNKLDIGASHMQVTLKMYYA
jgi:hypothetical protein